MEKILLTGVTGIVGSHVFYELISEMIFEKRECEIYLLVRSKEKCSASQRLQNEVFDPRILPLNLKSVSFDSIMKRIHVIDGSLTNFKVPNELGDKINIFHIAASVNLGTSTSSFEDVYKNNYQATKIFIDKLKNRIGKINYISTAFSSGNRWAIIHDDYHSFKKYDFRNPYEQYKHKLESELLERADKGEFECAILRPSVVCGRLIEEPHFIMNRYIVFYMIGAFLNKMTKKFGKIDKFRILADPNGGLNIVPVDYVAKGIVRASKTKIKQLNITTSNNVPNKFWIPLIMEREGVETFEFVNEIPTDLTPIERMYYKTVGPQINKYLKTSAHMFKSDKIRKVLNDVVEPNVINKFPKLYSFAHDNDFKLSA